MTKKENEVLEALVSEFKEVRLAIVGNTELGLQGLVEAQKADEEYKRLNDEHFKEVTSHLEKLSSHQEKLSSHQEKQYKKLTDMDGRITQIEEPLKVLRVVLNVARKFKSGILAIVAFVTSLLALVYKFWHVITDWFTNPTNP